MKSAIGLLKKIATCIALAGIFCVLVHRPAVADDLGSMAGTWEGTLTMIHGQGLRAKDYPPQTWRMVVQGSTARMFIRGDQGQFSEVKPGGFRMVRHLSNALIYSVDSASDSSWIETEAWSLIQKTPDELLALFSGAVRNPKPDAPDLLNFFTVRTGTFKRIQ